MLGPAADEGSFQEMRRSAVQQGPLERAMAGLLWALSVLLFIWVFANFIMAFLAWPYCIMREAMRCDAQYSRACMHAAGAVWGWSKGAEGFHGRGRERLECKAARIATQHSAAQHSIARQVTSHDITRHHTTSLLPQSHVARRA